MCTTLLCWKRGLTCAALIGSAARTWSSKAFFQRDLFQNMQLSSDTLQPSTAHLLHSRSRGDARGSKSMGAWLVCQYVDISMIRIRPYGHMYRKRQCIDICIGAACRRRLPSCFHVVVFFSLSLIASTQNT